MAGDELRIFEIAQNVLPREVVAAIRTLVEATTVRIASGTSISRSP
jgi:hypothetical protein